MNRSHHIFEFIDGALDSSSEQELFDDLARHPEMRAELRHYVAIGEAVRADREAFVPPAYVEHSLMAGLGIAPLAGTGGAAVGAGAGVLARFGLLKGVAPMAASFILGALLAGGGIFLALDESLRDGDPSSLRDTIVVYSSGGAASPSVSAQQSPQATQLATDESPALAESSTRRATSSGVTSSRSTRATVSSSLPRAWRPTTDIQSDASVVELADEAPSVMIESEVDDVRAIAMASPRSIEPALATDEPRAIDASKFISPESVFDRQEGRSFLELRRATLLAPYVGNSAREVAPKPLDEASLGFYVSATDDWSIGLELGQGRYAQVLVLPEDYVDANGERIGSQFSRVEQNPNIFWVGFGGRYNLGETIGGIGGWAQGTLGYGFANGGPLVNTRFGLSKQITSAVSLTTALETTTLVYMFNGQPLVSGKYGLTLGMQVGW